MKTTMQERGVLVLPAQLRRKDRLRRGTRFKISRKAEGVYEFRLDQPVTPRKVSVRRGVIYGAAAASIEAVQSAYADLL